MRFGPDQQVRVRRFGEEAQNLGHGFRSQFPRSTRAGCEIG
jgi:hypothetical protein